MRVKTTQNGQADLGSILKPIVKWWRRFLFLFIIGAAVTIFLAKSKLEVALLFLGIGLLSALLVLVVDNPALEVAIKTSRMPWQMVFFISLFHFFLAGMTLGISLKGEGLSALAIVLGSWVVWAGYVLLRVVRQEEVSQTQQKITLLGNRQLMITLVTLLAILSVRVGYLVIR